MSIGSFGPRNVPICMKLVEVMGIEQARKWNVATLNEFRAYFGLIPHQSFRDITTNEQVANSLEALYGTPDAVELYPGLVAEDAKQPMIPGSGLCPGFTTTTAILADATALVRGDRFYTVVSAIIVGACPKADPCSGLQCGNIHQLGISADCSKSSNSKRWCIV